jgi:Sulfotransferase domain
VSIRNLVPDSLRPAARRAALAAGAVTRRWRMDPDFIVIGGQRCGTTTLFKTLADHPQVRRPTAVKGTDYYTLHYARGLDWYRSRMPLALGASADAKAFEACTYYMFHPFAIERIARDYPDVKLVAMLRDPVSRAFSAYKHELARGFETETDFLAALRLEPARLEGEVEKMRADVSYQSFSHRHHAYLSRGQFAEQLERVYHHFPRNQVHVMRSETFFADPHAEIGKLTDFLGLAPWMPAHVEQHNARPSSGMPGQAHEFLVQHFRPHNEALEELLTAQSA